MRRAFGILALVPVLAMVSACGGASKVKSEIASAAEPRAALAAAAEAMSKESYYLEYVAKFEDDGDDFGGTIIIAHRDSDTIFRMKADGFEMAFINSGDKNYWCVGGRESSVFDSDDEGGCYEGMVDEDESAESVDIDDFFFDTQSLLKELIDDDKIEITDADDRTIAGIEGRCFNVKSDEDGDGELCVAKDSGVLLLVDGGFNSEDGSLRLKSTHEPKDSDFELPFKVTDFSDLFGGLTGGSSDGGGFEEPAPEQDKEASIPSQRIAGSLYEWETRPALCPDLHPDLGGLVALGGGRFLLTDYDDSVIVSSDCKVAKIQLDSFDVAGIGDGNVYYSESSFDGSALVRRSPDGSETTIAGAACDSKKVCKTGAEGQATEVVLDWVQGIAPGTDGSVWFLETITDAGKNDALLRLRHVTAQGELKTVDTGKKLDFAQIATGPNGGVYVLQFDGSILLDASGKVVKSKLKLDYGCFASSRDGDLWTYDLSNNDLMVTRVDGSTKSFHWAPEKSFFCQRIAVQPNGDLLVQSFGIGGGLWLVPNPLK